MFRYFGFGSNMSTLSLQAKGVDPVSSVRAELACWQLRFNVQHFFRHEGGVGNIEFTGNPDHRVLGVLHECPDEALPLLDAAEAFGYGYDRITVPVKPHQQSFDSDDAVQALTYVGMPNFINDECLPSQRYLNILVQGAREAELDQAYLENLRAQPIHSPPDYPEFMPPAGRFPEFDKETLAERPLLTSLYGCVFDMTEARPQHEFLKGFFGGRDMTLFHLQRMDSATLNETMDDVRHGRLNAAQTQYLNAFLNEYAREYRFVGHYSYQKD
ncbi:gamma-glutamylcyclotransferase family protein [Marinobacter halotolerans]|uniref:gamma-glutamylcyclotransferase family protein n=1 Tax=Marinobacter halotolerans TaxID=1569211 RepID=UPI001244F943|nr:gamma-glutamylcyclotransferase family protein [Marinobacter halotolerans]